MPWWLCPSSSQMASLMISRGVCWYPLVRNSSALAYRDGESRRPGRVGSSPMHSRIVRTAPHIFSRRCASEAGSGFSALPAAMRVSPKQSRESVEEKVGRDEERWGWWDEPVMTSDLLRSSRSILGLFDAAATAAASSSSSRLSAPSALAVPFARPLLRFLPPLFRLRFFPFPFALPVLPATLADSSASASLAARLACFCSFCTFATGAGAGTTEVAEGAIFAGLFLAILGVSGRFAGSGFAQCILLRGWWGSRGVLRCWGRFYAGGGPVRSPEEKDGAIKANRLRVQTF